MSNLKNYTKKNSSVFDILWQVKLCSTPNIGKASEVEVTAGIWPDTSQQSSQQASKLYLCMGGGTMAVPSGRGAADVWPALHVTSATRIGEALAQPPWRRTIQRPSVEQKERLKWYEAGHESLKPLGIGFVKWIVCLVELLRLSSLKLI